MTTRENEDQIVFVVDDDDDLRSSLKRSLSIRGYLVEDFRTGEAFLDAFGKGRPGCVILDQGLPGMDGLEVQAALKDRGITAQVIFITGHGGVRESVRATKAGSLDFLEKPYPPEILVERIEEALALDREVHHSKKELRDRTAALESLTSREREVFDLMIARPDLSSSKGVAQELDISPRTVDKHRAQILSKTGCRSVADLIARYTAASP